MGRIENASVTSRRMRVKMCRSNGPRLQMHDSIQGSAAASEPSDPALFMEEKKKTPFYIYMNGSGACSAGRD